MRAGTVELWQASTDTLVLKGLHIVHLLYSHKAHKTKHAQTLAPPLYKRPSICTTWPDRQHHDCKRHVHKQLPLSYMQGFRCLHCSAASEGDTTCVRRLIHKPPLLCGTAMAAGVLAGPL